MFNAMMKTVELALLMLNWWVGAAYQLSCQVNGVDVTCPPRACPSSQVTFTCTVDRALGSNLWKLPTNSCPTADKIVLTQTSGICNGVNKTCGPFTARNTPSNSTCLTSSLIVIATSTAVTNITCGFINISGYETIVNNGSIDIIDIPGQIFNAAITTAVNSSTSSIAEYSVTVMWSPPTRGGAPTSYNVSINNSTPIIIPANNSNGSLTYTYNRLMSDTVYEVSIVAINCAGASNATVATMRTWADPPDYIFAAVWDEILTFHWSPVGGSVSHYSIEVFSNGTLIRNDRAPCISPLCSYSLQTNISNRIYMASIASINEDNVVGIRHSYTIGIMLQRGYFSSQAMDNTCAGTGCDPVVISVATMAFTMCTLEFIAIISITVVCIKQKTKFRKQLQVQSPLSSNFEIKNNEAYETILVQSLHQHTAAL